MATAKRAITLDRIRNVIKQGDYSRAVHMCRAMENPLRKIIDKKNGELAAIVELRRLAAGRAAAAVEESDE